MIKDLDGYSWWGETDTEGVILRPELLPSAGGTTAMILASRTQGLGITRDAKRIIATRNTVENANNGGVNSYENEQARNNPAVLHGRAISINSHFVE